MDRTGRIVGVWIVGCMIPGIVLVVANAPLGVATWTDQQIFQTRIGWLLIGLGIVGVVAEFAIVLWGFRRPPSPPPSIETAIRARPSDSAELAQTKAKLAEVLAATSADRMAKRVQSLMALSQEATERAAKYSAPEMASRPASPEAYTDLDSFDRSVKSVISDEPDDLDFYKPQNEAIVWSALAWHQHLVTMYQIRQRLLSQLRMRQMNRGDA